MRRITLLFVAFLLGSTLLLGCSPPWRVVRQASPNPFIGQTKFAVLPIDFRGLQVGDTTEAEWQADKDAETQQSWAGDKLAMNEEFASHLMSNAQDSGINVVRATAPGDAPFVIQPRIGWLEPGIYTYVYNKASEVKMTVVILTADGKPLDEIALTHGTGASIANAGVGNRLRDDAEGLGRFMALYLEHRTTGKTE